MAATGGSSAAVSPHRNVEPENALAVSINLSSIPIYQFEEDIAELRNMIKRDISTPSEVSMAANRAVILRITLNIKKYLDETYPGKNIPLSLTKTDSVIEMVEQLYKDTPGLNMEALRSKLYIVIQKEIGSSGTIGERLMRLYGRASAATTKNQLTMTAMAVLALVSEISQYNTNVTLNTTFSGKVGGRRGRTCRRRAKKLTRRGRRHTRRQ